MCMSVLRTAKVWSIILHTIFEFNGHGLIDTLHEKSVLTVSVCLSPDFCARRDEMSYATVKANRVSHT